MNECPLGAAALAGTSFPIDRHATAQALGFDRPTANSLDSVSDRDFALEALAAASICAMHLSRLAEEIVIWTTPQFGFVEALRQVHDRLVDHAAEAQSRMRPSWCAARPGRVIGALNALLIVMKGLPLTYGKDMQEDKEGLFDAMATLSLCIAAMAGMVARHGARAQGDEEGRRRGLRHGHRPRRLAGAHAEDAVPRGAPRHRPHRRPRRRSAASGWRSSTLAEMQAVEPRITHDVFEVLGVERSVAQPHQLWRTAPAEVRRQARRWLARLEGERPDEPGARHASAPARLSL